MNDYRLTIIQRRKSNVRADDGRVYASLRHMCDALGLNARGQSQRIDRHTVLSRGKGVCKIHTPGDPVTQSQAMQVSQAVKAVAIHRSGETNQKERIWRNLWGTLSPLRNHQLQDVASQQIRSACL